MSEEGYKLEGEHSFGVPTGLSSIKMMGGDEPSTVAEYLSKGMTGAEPGKFSVNNGTIAAVTSSGEIIGWLPKADRNEPRTVSFEQAIRNLQEAGYTAGGFYVPFSNK